MRAKISRYTGTRIASASVARRIGCFALMIAGTWTATTTANTHSSTTSQGTSEPWPARLAGIRKYAVNRTEMEIVARSSVRRASFQACLGALGTGWLHNVIARSTAVAFFRRLSSRRPGPRVVDPSCGGRCRQREGGRGRRGGGIVEGAPRRAVPGDHDGH